MSYFRTPVINHECLRFSEASRSRRSVKPITGYFSRRISEAHASERKTGWGLRVSSFHLSRSGVRFHTIARPLSGI